MVALISLSKVISAIWILAIRERPQEKQEVEEGEEQEKQEAEVQVRLQR